MKESDDFPTMYRIKQKFKSYALQNPEMELRRKLNAKTIMKTVKPGMKVAIALGSRGISNIVNLAAAVVDELKLKGAYPYIVPAMGAQGSGTSEGQREVLRALGIVEKDIHAPILSSERIIKIGETTNGLPLYCDEIATNADKIFIINRIKAHTAFKADIESGLLKMIAVGLGKQKSAETVHTSPYGLAKTIPEVASALMKKIPISLGIAIVEDALHQIAKIEALDPEEIFDKEKELLIEAKRMMARLPFDTLDVLVVEQMGKNISGTGMDTNVIGIGRRIGGRWKPEIDKIVVLDLTDESHGNAVGIGLADVTTERLVKKIDFDAMYTNCITTGFLGTGKIPVTMKSDREAVRVALKSYNIHHVRLVRIKNTVDLKEMDISEALCEEAEKRENISIIRKQGSFKFSYDGSIV